MHGRHSEFRAKRPGVITGRSGSIGKVYFVDEDYWPHNTALYVKDFRGNEPKYVFFLLQWLDLETICSGSGVPTLDRKEVHKLSVSHPDRETQVRIAAILTDQMTAVEQTQKALKEQLDTINKLPATFLRRAFEGKI
jgi:type I restriction enzyme S subunit